MICRVDHHGLQVIHTLLDGADGESNQRDLKRNHAVVLIVSKIFNGRKLSRKLSRKLRLSFYNCYMIRYAAHGRNFCEQVLQRMLLELWEGEATPVENIWHSGESRGSSRVSCCFLVS